jgi:hypothetical protein
MNLIHSEVGMRVSVECDEVPFASGDTESATWQRAVAAHLTLSPGFYRSGRYASRLRYPPVVVGDQDQSALAGLGTAHRAPRAEQVHLPGHCTSYMDVHEQAVEAELFFLCRQLLDHVHADRPGTGTADSAPHRGGRA